MDGKTLEGGLVPSGKLIIFRSRRGRDRGQTMINIGYPLCNLITFEGVFPFVEEWWCRRGRLPHPFFAFNPNAFFLKIKSEYTPRRKPPLQRYHQAKRKLCLARGPFSILESLINPSDSSPCNRRTANGRRNKPVCNSPGFTIICRSMQKVFDRFNWGVSCPISFRLVQ